MPHGIADLVEAREREEVLDEHAHAGGLLLDPAHRLLGVRGIARGPEAEELGVAAHGGQRGAELMGGVGEEPAQALLARLALGEGLLEPGEHGVEREA